MDTVHKLHRSSRRIGVLVPFTNVNLEPDLQLMAPPDVSLHYTRIGGYSVDVVPGADEMAGMGTASIDSACKLIAGCHPDAVLYGCTSATLALGPEFDILLAEKIKAATGAISITAAGAIVFALKSLGVQKIALATPYEDEINNRTIEFLEREGIKTMSSARMNASLLSHQQGDISPEEVIELALKADHKDAEAIVLACTDLRAVEAIPFIEKATRKPVVTSNQAMMFAICSKLGTKQISENFGRLTERIDV